MTGGKQKRVNARDSQRAPIGSRAIPTHAPHGQSRRAISTARLWTSPPLHLQPIYVIVSDGPVRPHLAAGFALRCVQRLSDPGLDTLRCAWRHNRSTSGRSVTVLSY